jgi:hypothetical protein
MRYYLKETPGYMFRPSLGHPQANTNIIKYNVTTAAQTRLVRWKLDGTLNFLGFPVKTMVLRSSWNVMAHSDAREGDKI